MYKILKKVGILTIALLLLNIAAQAQCAMCRATLENNFSSGEIGTAANINIGILYLFVFPYLLVGVVAFFWYKKSKATRAAGL